jgi:hypothetical protein
MCLTPDAIGRQSNPLCNVAQWLEPEKSLSSLPIPPLLRHCRCRLLAMSLCGAKCCGVT